MLDCPSNWWKTQTHKITRTINRIFVPCLQITSARLSFIRISVSFPLFRCPLKRSLKLAIRGTCELTDKRREVKWVHPQSLNNVTVLVIKPSSWVYIPDYLNQIYFIIWEDNNCITLVTKDVPTLTEMTSEKLSEWNAGENSSDQSNLVDWTSFDMNDVAHFDFGDMPQIEPQLREGPTEVTQATSASCSHCQCAQTKS